MTTKKSKILLYTGLAIVGAAILYVAYSGIVMSLWLSYTFTHWTP